MAHRQAVALLALALAPHPSAAQWTLKKLDLNKYPLAVCLDGSPGAFYVSPGAASSFVLHLQG